MSRLHRPGHYGGRSKQALPQPGDEAVGTWPREQLVRMDADFCERMNRAIAAGKEKPPDGEASERAA
jgi:hypothetical protein